jgi:hypothetical protein
VDDVRVQSGYPLWNVVDVWMGAGYDDEALIRAYPLDPAEWAAAKQYHLEHKPILDARIIANTQPAADDALPPMRTVEDYFSWLARTSKDSAASQRPVSSAPSSPSASSSTSSSSSHSSSSSSTSGYCGGAVPYWATTRG